MKNFKQNLMHLNLSLFIVLILTSAASATQTLPKVGTQETIGKVGDLTIEAIVQSPSAQETPLQISLSF